MHSSTFSLELEHHLHPYVHRRAQTWSQLVSHPDFSCIYPHLLVQTYLYVKYSCPLMRRAAASLDADRYQPFIAYLHDHTEEEADHDVWLLADLRELGVSDTVATTTLAARSISSLVGTQHYLLEEGLPLAIMGYIYALEAYPARAEVLRKIAGAHNIPLGSMNTFLEHSDRDIEHRDHLLALLDSIELSAAEKRVIVYSAIMTAAHVGEFIEDLARAVQHGKGCGENEEVEGTAQLQS